MKQQSDWYTGINHYDNYVEKEIGIERKTIDGPTVPYLHEQVELFYVLSGKGAISVNGYTYEAAPGCLFCMYSHHFHHVEAVEEKLDVAVIRFHIGLFMYMSWEKHPKHANARLVYDTKPMVQLAGEERTEVEALVYSILKESAEDRFERLNMIEYKTLELHAYYCRFAYEKIGKAGWKGRSVWNIIEKVILTTSDDLTLEDMTEEMIREISADPACETSKICSPETLNRKIKEASGFTFFQLKQFGRVINACALLHFPELSMEYIGDLLNFSSTAAFYRVFKQYCGVTPREYQAEYIGIEPPGSGAGTAMQFLQYIHMHFSEDIKLDDLCAKFCMKPYTAKRIFKEVFGNSFEELLAQVRVSYACAFLRTGNRTVLEIASLCGFNSQSTFLRHFKQWMNQTPEEYREVMREQSDAGTE